MFNKFFTNIGPELTGTTSRTFETFLNKIDTTMPVDPITINELRKAFFLKNKQKRGLWQGKLKCYQNLPQ